MYGKKERWRLVHAMSSSNFKAIFEEGTTVKDRVSILQQGEYIATG
jgi:hypothetical protein